MKYAKSLAYGGELIDALECEHADFKRLVPLCPNCSNPVHLRIGGDRISAKGTPYKIGPHFAHFAGKSAEEVAACELRVNGYTQADREQIQKVARGQREKWVRRWLWKVFRGFWTGKHPGMPEDLQKKVDFYSGTPQGMAEVLDRAMKDPSVITFAAEHAAVHCEIKSTKPVPDDWGGAWGSKVSLPPSLEGVEKELHLAILSEIFAYLKTRGARPVLENFYRLIYAVDGMDNLANRATLVKGSATKDGLEKYMMTVAYTLQLFCFVVPWATEFARLEAEEAAKVGKKCAA